MTVLAYIIASIIRGYHFKKEANERRKIKKKEEKERKAKEARERTIAAAQPMVSEQISQILLGL